MDFTLKQLAYFAAAADAGNVSAAAQRLNVSQPSISAAIAALERGFGVTLFQRRHARGVDLTPAGQRLFAEARALLAHAQEFQTAARGEGDALAGPLELGCFVTLAPFFLPALLSGFAAAHPGIQVRPREGDHASLCRGLLSGAFDLALLYDLGFEDGIAAEPVGQVPLRAVLPAEHRLAKRRYVPLTALAPEPFILLDLPQSADYFLALFRARGLEPNIRHRTPSFELARGLVAGGHGYSLLNLAPAHDRTYDGGRVAVRPLDETIPPLKIVVARAAQARPTRRALAFRGHATVFFDDKTL
ncbi:MAG: LysR family transcriptional regulator [Alphaproteobacteria bacterium]|nr:LysR family transcriptional regulator [Alphaproteobacteria bacterium]